MPTNLDSNFKKFIYGFSTPFRVLPLLIDHPKLMLLSLLPIFVTLVLIAMTIYALLAGAWHFSQDQFSLWMGTYAHWFSGFTTFVAAAILLYFSFHTLSIFIALCASPFNDLLAEETEQALGQAPQKTNLLSLIQVFFLDLRKTFLSLLFVCLLSLLGFIPIIGVLTFLGFSLIQTFTFVTYPQSRRKQGVTRSLGWIRENLPASLGFGLVTLLLFGIPVLNLFALPLSVIGGTLLFLQK